MLKTAGAPPAPVWVLRHHAPSPVHSVALVNRGELLVIGDARGRVSVVQLSTYRPLVYWDAHSDAVLRADAWHGLLVTCVDVLTQTWSGPQLAGVGDA